MGAAGLRTRRGTHAAVPIAAGAETRTCLALFPLPLWERVAEGRVRGPAARDRDGRDRDGRMGTAAGTETRRANTQS